MRNILPAIVFSLIILSASAQKRVAIINLMDSVLLHVNIGTTVFENSTRAFDCQFNPKKYVHDEIERFLSLKFSLAYPIVNNQLVKQTDDLPEDEIYEPGLSAKLNYKDWVKEHKTEYNYVIFIENRPWVDPLIGIQLQSNGLFTGGNFIKHWALVYSTVYFTAYSTKTLKKLYYDKSTWFYTRTINEYKFPEKKTGIAGEMLPAIIERLSGLIDSRTEHFMVGTGLLSEVEYYNIKMGKQ